MDNDGEINKPGEDVVIGSDFNGSIRCRNLEIRPGVTVVGTAVVEDTTKIAGSFEGVLDTEVFLSSPTARCRGTVYAAQNSCKGDTKVFLDSTRQAVFQREPAHIPEHAEEAISRAIDEAIASRVKSVAPSVAKEAPTEAPAPVLSLSERLASKGLSLHPDYEEPAVQADEPGLAAVSSPVTRTSHLTALPSLV